MDVGVNASTMWVMVALGAFHGINPAMGWLFAVARGLQERRALAVLGALVPIALGHLVAIATVILLTMVVGATLPVVILREIVGALLVGLGGYALLRHLHPRWVRMRVGFGDLIVWSALVATVHGAGLMVVPVLLGTSGDQVAHGASAHVHVAQAGPLAALVATGAHTVGYFVVMGAVAWIVYRFVGVGFLRTAWFNVDLVWAVALIAAGLFTLVL
jgi:hypothetical protein